MDRWQWSGGGLGSQQQETKGLVVVRVPMQVDKDSLKATEAQ